MKLRIFCKKLQIYNEQQHPIHYIGTNPNNLNIVSGLIPDNDWRDFTEDVENLEKLNLLWKLKEDGAEGRSTSNMEKAASDEITFTNKAYLFIKEWLIDSVSAPLNGVEVKVQVDGGILSGYIVKNDGISYCDDDTCLIDLMLKQKDEQYSCIQTTMIADNHSGMFSGDYQHPRFEYCNELRPTWLLTVLWSIMAIQYVLNIMILPVIVIILSVVIAVLFIIDWISKKLREQRKKLQASLAALMPGPFTRNYVDQMMKLGGCERTHPAPLIRDYISNVCSKCGVNVTKKSLPLFFDPASPYYNLTMLSAEVKKGLKIDDGRHFIPDNKPLLTLDMFLNDMKRVFNAKWYVKNNTLFFARKDFDEIPGFVYDFTGKDKSKIIDGVCFTWNEEKKKSYARLGYTTDAFDNLSADAKNRFNDIVEFNRPVNPMLEGEDNRTVSTFAAARFRQDGVYYDYISEALEYMWIVSVVTIGLAEILLNSLRKKFEGYKGAVIMQNDTLMLPKLIIWDGVNRKYARAKYSHIYGGAMPIPNPAYNVNQLPYQQIHTQDVPWDAHYKEYCKLYNYEMAFDGNFQGNLYDRFHQIDDPRLNPPLNKNWELKMPLCYEDMEILGVLDDSQNIALGRKVKMNAGDYYKEGVIEEIELSFDPFDKIGSWIKLKGRI